MIHIVMRIRSNINDMCFCFTLEDNETKEIGRKNRPKKSKTSLISALVLDKLEMFFRVIRLQNVLD